MSLMMISIRFVMLTMTKASSGPYLRSVRYKHRCGRTEFQLGDKVYGEVEFDHALLRKQRRRSA